MKGLFQWIKAVEEAAPSRVASLTALLEAQEYERAESKDRNKPWFKLTQKKGGKELLVQRKRRLQDEGANYQGLL